MNNNDIENINIKNVRKSLSPTPSFNDTFPPPSSPSFPTPLQFLHLPPTPRTPYGKCDETCEASAFFQVVYGTVVVCAAKGVG